MEASGSRQSRAASRYASSPSAPVFSGPVRKWKKQWVSHSTNLNNAAKRNHTPPPPPLLLCRWTPLSAADEPPKRRFRYAPIVPIEKGKKKGGEDEGGASLKNHINNGSDMVETGEFSKEEPQEVSEDQADSSKTQHPGARSEHKTECAQGKCYV